MTGELARNEADLAAIPDQQAVALSGLARAFVLSVAARYDEAADASFAAAKASRVLAIWALPLAGRFAVLAHDAERARDAVGQLELDGISGPALAADVETILAGCDALEGDPGHAMARYRVAMADWRDLGLSWDEALCGLDMALLLDPADPEVQAAAGRAREIFTRLEATPFLGQLDAALARAVERAGPTRRAVRPGVPDAAVEAG